MDVVFKLAQPRLARLADGQADIAGATVGNDLTRADPVEALYRKVGVSRAESARLIELVFKEITDCLERGETVKLSSFGLLAAARIRAFLAEGCQGGRPRPRPSP